MNTTNPKPQRKIFLADDDDEDRLLFVEALHEIDDSIMVTEVENGRQLMDTLQTTSDALPEIVFLDINMPKLDGFECLSAIRKRENLSKLNVIMFSTCNNPVTIEKAYHLGASFYAIKPNSYSGLKTLIKKILQIDWVAVSEHHKNFCLTKI